MQASPPTFNLRLAVITLTAAGLAACTAPGGYGGYGGYPGASPSAYAPPDAAAAQAVNGYGVVQAIDTVAADTSGVGVGTIAGAVAGGLLGNQIGQGRGNTAATVAGVAGGALAGREVEKNMRRNTPAYRVTLRMDDGSLRSIVQASPPAARIGERVRVVNGVIS